MIGFIVWPPVVIEARLIAPLAWVKELCLDVGALEPVGCHQGEVGEVYHAVCVEVLSVRGSPPAGKNGRCFGATTTGEGSTRSQYAATNSTHGRPMFKLGRIGRGCE